MRAMNTKYIIITLIVCLLVPVRSGFSQKVFRSKNIKAEQKVLREKNNQIEVGLRFDLDSIKISSNESHILVPVIKDNSGNQVLLPEVIINGKTRQKVYERKINLNSNLDTYKNAYLIIKEGDLTQKNIDYFVTTPYQPWMRDAKLYIQKDKCGCADARDIMAETELGRILFRPDKPYKPQPVVTYIVPKAEAVKSRNEVGEAYLDFIVGRYNILPEFRRNPVELAKVDSLINQLVSDQNVFVNAVIFTGKASPEASYTYNMTLSQNRAQALQDYVNGRYSLKKEWLQAKSLGEDWESFERLIIKSEHKDRDAVLNIIRTEKDPDAKEKDLRNLNNGNTYKYLNEEIFPQLRRVECRVDYTVRAFSVDEGKLIIDKRPQQLSLNEMFLIANTYEKGSDNFNRVFEVAVRIFPDDEVANANAAATALSNGDTEKARLYMTKYKESAEHYNNIGVLYLQEGDLEKAEEYLLKAKSKGVSEADKNMKELKLKKADNDLFESFDK